MESKDDLVSQLADAEYEWVNALVVSYNNKEAQKWRYRIEVLIAKIKMENHNVSRSEKRRLGSKIDCALKEMEKARESGDIAALVAAKKKFKEVQEEIKKAYGE